MTVDEGGLRSEVITFFDDFVTAFRTFDGGEVARRYIAPYVALHADGSLACLTSQADIAQVFQQVVNAYHAEGCRSCRYHGLHVQLLGARSLLATVTWELLRGDGSVLKEWRESYNPACVADGWRIFASVDHVA